MNHKGYFLSIRCAQIIVSLALCCGFISAAYAGSPPFEDLKHDYLLLRNRDPQAKDADHWRAMARRLETSRRLNARENDQALFMAGTLYAELVKQGAKSSGNDARRALIILRDVSGRGGEYADDALARAAELYITLGNRRSAAAVAEELRTRFAGSEFAPGISSLIISNNGVGDSSVRPANASVTAVDVVLDPGHGGDDLGAEGYAGLLEKDVTLSIALRAKKALEARGISVALTRTSDYFLPLSARTNIANKLKARAFVSIHANASLGSKQKGVETYVLDANQNANTKLLAERENGNEANDLAFLLSDVIQREKSPEAIALATTLQHRIVNGLEQSGFESVNLGVKKAPFFVLVGSHMASVLIEIGFIDNSREGRDLGSDRYRAASAEAIAAGIAQFLKKDR